MKRRLFPLAFPQRYFHSAILLLWAILIVALGMPVSEAAYAKQIATHRSANTKAVAKPLPQSQQATAKPLPLAADSATLSFLQTFETTLYGVNYVDETVNNRLNRLEETVFGQPQTGQAANSRVSRLNSVLASRIEQAAAQRQPSQSQSQPGNNSTPSPQPQQNDRQVEQQQPETARNPDETDYPAVTIMERKLYNRDYRQEDITQRLNRLESAVFHGPQGGGLAERVDQLRTTVLGDNPGSEDSPLAGANRDPLSNGTRYGAGNQSAYPYSPPNPYSGQENGSYYNQQQAYTLPAGSANGQDLQNAVAEVEKQVLGHTFPAEPLTARLDRIEIKVFNGTSPELSSEERVQRVIAVASAGGAPLSPKEKAKSTFHSLLPVILTILPMLLL